MLTCLISGFWAQRRKRTSRPGLAAGQRIEIAGGDEVFGIGEEHGHALARGRVDQVPLDQAVQEQEHGVGVAGPIARLSPALR